MLVRIHALLVARCDLNAAGKQLNARSDLQSERNGLRICNPYVKKMIFIIEFKHKSILLQ